MSIPTGYTLETFRDWLTGEVFFEDPKGLGLSAIRGSSPATYKDLILSGNTTFTPTLNSTYTLHIEPSPFIFDRNEVITLENGIQLTVNPSTAYSGYYNPPPVAIVGVNYGDTTMVVKVTGIPAGTDIHDGLKLRVQESSGEAGLSNPTIEGIMNKALARIGLEHISQVTSENMYLFRKVAVIEAVETVMQSKASIYSYEPLSDGANTFYAAQVPSQLRALLGSENADLINYVSSHNIDLEGEDVAPNIPDDVLSATASIGVVW